MSVTFIIIGITVVVSFLAFNDRRLMDRLVLWPPAVQRDGQYYRLLTHGFVHGDGMHLLFNMLTLYFFGPSIERLLGAMAGPWAYPAFYVAAIIVSILPWQHAHRNRSDVASLGASGAVCAVLFAYILFDPWATLLLFFVVPAPAIVLAIGYVAYSIYMDRRTDRGTGAKINHNAHLWGAAFGIAFMLVVEPSVLGHFLDRLAHPRFSPMGHFGAF
ncbi:rhomboid family intramembrane serine protease [Tahibacter soli]|uniref:Rhomboid family intramembrane serine protease n=1 Tax=Tahibacter soli TaxID=2983605 RepID=A0A9X3YHA2_9GAMM|nr:rhomboid family intramembrane serine protease [Tahibacter soli]MDC8012247.1 rhomboid family intramembrane serine protease [Tahibacter soli]